MNEWSRRITRGLYRDIDYLPTELIVRLLLLLGLMDGMLFPLLSYSLLLGNNTNMKKLYGQLHAWYGYWQRI